MRSTPLAVVVALLMVVGLVAPARAADAAAELVAEAEAVLKKAGLEKRGPVYLLAEETELVKLIAEVRKAQADLKKDSAAGDAAEKKVTQVKSYIAGKELEARKIYDELAKGGLTAERNNQLVAKLRSLEGDIKTVQEGQLKKFQEAFNTANDAYIKTRGTYIEKALAADALAEKTAARYAELAKNADVSGALEQIAAATEKKVAIGPSAAFKGNVAVIKTTRKSLDNESIPVKVEDDVSTVEVMLNGKVRRTMTVDTGASLMSVPADLAETLGLTPSEDTQKIRLQLADGKIVEAWLMTLKSVQVGPFLVENVECAVLPASLVAAEPLLGGSYLKHFIVKLDAERAKLELTRIKK